MDNKKIEQMFLAARSHNAEVSEKIEKLRKAAREMAYILNAEMPDGSNKTVALDRIRESVMWGAEGIESQSR